MNDNILSTIKIMLGLEDDYTPFDRQLIEHINSAIMILYQLGVGTPRYMLVDGSELWDSYIPDSTMLGSVKEYVYTKVRQIFDPPSSSFVNTSLDNRIRELEWRLNVQVDPAPLE